MVVVVVSMVLRGGEGRVVGQPVGDDREVLADALDLGRVDAHAQHLLAGPGLGQDGPGGVHDAAVPAELDALLDADGVAGQDEHLVLDGAGGGQEPPVLPAGGGPRGGDDDELDAAGAELRPEAGEAQVVARRPGDRPEGGLGHGEGVARGEQLCLAGLVAEDVDLAVAVHEPATAVEEDRGVPQPAVVVLLDDAADVQVRAEVRGDPRAHLQGGPGEVLGEFGVAVEVEVAGAPQLGEDDEVRALDAAQHLLGAGDAVLAALPVGARELDECNFHGECPC